MTAPASKLLQPITVGPLELKNRIMFPPLTTVRPGFEQLGVAAMRETLFLLGEGDENSFASSQHGVGLIPAKVIGRTSLGTASRR